MTALAIPKQRKKDNERFRRWIADLPCIITGLPVDVQCCHIRKNSGAGIGEKPKDVGNCVPMSVGEHTRQHSIGETTYWNKFGGIDRAKSLASDLGEIYLGGGDKAAAVFRIMKFQRGQ